MINLQYTRGLMGLCCESVRSDVGRRPMTVFILSPE
jgi:hypothetical protein